MHAEELWWGQVNRHIQQLSPINWTDFIKLYNCTYATDRELSNKTHIGVCSGLSMHTYSKIYQVRSL